MGDTWGQAPRRKGPSRRGEEEMEEVRKIVVSIVLCMVVVEVKSTF